MYGGDEVSALVLDIGSHLTKAGYAGEDAPRVVVPSYVGTISSGSEMDVETQYFPGDKLYLRRDSMKVRPVVQNKFDWELVEQLTKDSIQNELKLETKDHPFIVSEPSIHDRETRTKFTEMMFESFGVPACYIVKSGVLSSFASGRSTSLVLDSGGNFTYSVPVHDGYVLQKGILCFNIGGETITTKLQENLQSRVAVRPNYTFTKQIKCMVEAGETTGAIDFTIEEHDYPNTDPSFHDFMVREIVREVKESSCKVSDTPYSETGFSNVPATGYELPDGVNIELGNERFSIPEVLFTGDEKTVGFSGLHQMVYDSITRCDMDIRRELYGNIVVTGGNSLFAGVTERLQKKMNELTTQNMKVKLIAPLSSIERRFSSWIGGSILASLGSFQQMWMSKQEYDEHGSFLVERKCP